CSGDVGRAFLPWHFCPQPAFSRPTKGFGRVGHRRVTLRTFPAPLIELDVRISRIQLSDHLLPAACAANQADVSLSLPFDTADSVCTGTDSSSASELTANSIDVCVVAIPAAHSARPNRSDERHVR